MISSCFQFYHDCQMYKQFKCSCYFILKKGRNFFWIILKENLTSRVWADLVFFAGYRMSSLIIRHALPDNPAISCRMPNIQPSPTVKRWFPCVSSTRTSWRRWPRSCFPTWPTPATTCSATRPSWSARRYSRSLVSGWVVEILQGSAFHSVRILIHNE